MWKKLCKKFEHFGKCTPEIYHRFPPFQIFKYATETRQKELV